MLRQYKRKNKAFSTSKADGTFGKRNALPRHKAEPTVDEFLDNVDESTDLLLDALWEQTDEEEEIVWDYLYPEDVDDLVDYA